MITSAPQTVVVYEPDFNRRSLVIETIRNASKTISIHIAQRWFDAESKMKESPSAVLIMQDGYARRARLPLSVIRYEKTFCPSELSRKIVETLIHPVALQGRKHWLDSFVGESPIIKAMRSTAELLSNRDASLLITGETGTGKSFLAELIHKASQRHAKPFKTICCPAITGTLWDSELNGHVRGAFTGANTDRMGRVEAAEGGTLLLDEVSEIPIETQAKLLDFLQHRRITRVGSNTEKAVNLRIISTSNQDLNAAIKQGRFRSDVYYRLKQVAIFIPPLRERGERDIVLLAEHALQTAAGEFGGQWLFSEDAKQLLSRQHWPGNARQLFDVVRQAALTAGAGVNVLTPDHFTELS